MDTPLPSRSRVRRPMVLPTVRRFRHHVRRHSYDDGATLCVDLSGNLHEADRSSRWSFSTSDILFRPAA